MSFFHLRACTLTRQHISHEHGFHQLILATSGCTELSIEGRGEFVTSERGCLIPTTYHHEYKGDDRNRTLVLDVPLASLPVLSCGDEINRLFARPCFFSVSPKLNRLADSLMQQVEHFPELQSEIATLILRAIYLGLHDERLPADMLGSPVGVRHRRRIDLSRIDAYIDAHLADEIRVETLASLCALSAGHFHACFRDVTGTTPLGYVQGRRLDHAFSLVRHTDLALGQIASLVGFRDQGSFSRAYLRRFKMSPLADRRAAN
ncbi:hypothetical protein L861_01825 [Litchfieldella anticariensis FP35 = DSM 16096]|uniref:HTH araC/xylS-type domain-containing protein n=1 Tax=Litchfieldella anticariensis (strain DSM 16096 / CECT 5854 / CIP 108499 / LMG 22089 / FP35) TaxID=1121939 RepID=S2KQB0_LITA3|nr:AraC family transcriptional regulator [Halomonas anticariensis]EPC04070.1 hypothetical protein L861_01825 [Halomonas anticariensis FP35 = DSM 16096]